MRGCYARVVFFLDEHFGGWKRVSRGAGIAWLGFYSLYFFYAAANRGGFLFLDNLNLIPHEAGHFFFSWFGYVLMILGGTFGELLVPFLCAAYFWRKRETSGFAFCSFWFFENFLYIGTYMADARAQALPLVGAGEHDWEILFGEWGLLTRDQQIGGITRAFGWLGMVTAIIWFGFHIQRNSQETEIPQAS